MNTGKCWRTSTLLLAALSLHAGAALESWALTSVGGVGGWWLVAMMLLTLVIIAALIWWKAPARSRPHPLAAMVLGSALVSLSIGVSLVAVLGVDGISPFTVGWDHPERTAWPQLALGAVLLTVGLPMARRLEWVRSLQDRSHDPGALLPRASDQPGQASDPPS